VQLLSCNVDRFSTSKNIVTLSQWSFVIGERRWP
jgi:hypothetical protein